MRTLQLLLLWSLSIGVTYADHAEMRRNVRIKAEPMTDAAAVYSATAGELMPLLDEGVQTNGYYHVSYAPGASGWVYRTMVRLHKGPIPAMPGENGSEPAVFNGTGQVPQGYYATATGLEGAALKLALHRTIRDHTVITYQDAWEALTRIDRDPEHPDNVVLIYTLRSQPAIHRDRGTRFNYSASGYTLLDSWNREHVWPKSHGFPNEQDTAYTDLHHLRPADRSVNSARNTRSFGYCSDVYYDNGGTVETRCRTSPPPDYCWEPPDEVKGDIARMLFYMAVRYEAPHCDLELVDRYVPNGNKLPQLGKLSTLLEWHLADPVDNWERMRNHVIYHEFQGNRNPFIDHPEWVPAIWGKGEGS
jgi:endonuclease I